MSTVTGDMIKPAEALASAPVARFAMFDSFGSEELDFATGASPAVATVKAVLAAYCLILLSMPKYSAEPAPVRMTDGVVPRHSDWIGFGPLRIFFKATVRELAPDCWTRVFKRSAGWRRKAVVTPEDNPARK